MNTSVTITLSNEASSTVDDSVFVHLEQEEIFNELDMGGVYQMWINAKAGRSARNVNASQCDVAFQDDKVFFSIPFNVFPSSMTLPYALTVSYGEIAEESHVLQNETEFPVFFDRTDGINNNRIYTNVKFSEKTPCFNVDGSDRPSPDVTVGDTYFEVDDAVFWVLQGSGVENGYTHYVDFEISTKDEEGNDIAITSIESTVTVSWTGEDGETYTEQLTLEIPDCILNSLQLCNGKPSMVCHKCEGYILLVYFSTCTGEVLSTRKVDKYDNSNYWCEPLT